VGRRNLIRIVAFAAALLCVPAIAVAGTQAPTLTLQGQTVPTGAQALTAYFAATRRETAPWLRRLSTTHQARIRGVDFNRTVLFAGFLDGRSCAFDMRLRSWSQTANRLVVDVSFRKPPIGAGTCVRTSVSYLVLGFRRGTFARLPTVVELRARARN
jgi:hypothetical protein